MAGILGQRQGSSRQEIAQMAVGNFWFVGVLSCCLYTPDWRADNHGVYLVLWFGDEVPKNKRLKGIGRGFKRPSTPTALRQKLIEHSNAAREGRVAIIVLDVSRAARHSRPSSV